MKGKVYQFHDICYRPICDLNPIERELIEIAMEPHRGWQSEIVKKYVSPVTEKNVSKMRISQILERAKEKVALVMSRTNGRE